MNESGIAVAPSPLASGRMQDGSGAPLLRVRVHSPFKVYFEGLAYSLSAGNATGPFDILPHHHKFLTLLTPGELVVRPLQGQPATIRISGGLMHVRNDVITVFLDV